MITLAIVTVMFFLWLIIITINNKFSISSNPDFDLHSGGITICLIIVILCVSAIISSSVAIYKGYNHSKKFKIENYSESELKKYKNEIILCDKIEIKERKKYTVIKYTDKNSKKDTLIVNKKDYEICKKEDTEDMYIEVYEIPDKKWKFNKWFIDRGAVSETNEFWYCRIYK